MKDDEPLISAATELPEITWKVILLAIVLALILATSNTYLALKIGMLTSASIPAAILSMGILRLFKRSNILENNLVQTAASAGEAIAGGIVYTIPALIIIHYWNHFGYLENFFIALCGGVLGVLFSVPLRRLLMNARHLRFPEGRAIAEVLRLGTHKKFGLHEMLWGGAVGGLLELAQTGFRVIATGFQAFFNVSGVMLGFGGGFSATLIGAGYLIGFNVALSLFVGALIAWGLGLPLLSIFEPTTAATAMNTYGGDIHYIGVGAMMTAGLWTLLGLLKPFYESLQLSYQAFIERSQSGVAALRTERDIPLLYVLIGIVLTLYVTYFLFKNTFNFDALTVTPWFIFTFIVVMITYVALMGFVLVAICGYFSGLVGVSASPGSGIIISGMLLAALLVRGFLLFHATPLSSTALLDGAAMTIIIGAVIAGAAAIANDNIQDLKVGHILGATPWKQQLMLLIGVLVAAAVVPLVMELLFNAYGIAGVFPHAGMDPTQVLAAPPAAMMAGITQGVFHHDLPWNMLGIGGGITVLMILLNYCLDAKGKGLSILAVAVGIYLPLTSSLPFFMGGVMALLVQKALRKREERLQPEHDETEHQHHAQKGLLLACGLVAGAALMDVLLAIPMAIEGNPDVLVIMPASAAPIGIVLGAASVLGLATWFYYIALQKPEA